MTERRLSVELAWVVDGTVRRQPLSLDPGATLADAIGRAVGEGLIAASALSGLGIGVFGRARLPGYRLCDGDRIELTAALSVDPKLARQHRVALRRAAQARDKWNPHR